MQEELRKTTSAVKTLISDEMIKAVESSNETRMAVQSYIPFNDCGTIRDVLADLEMRNALVLLVSKKLEHIGYNYNWEKIFLLAYLYNDMSYFRSRTSPLTHLSTPSWPQPCGRQATSKSSPFPEREAQVGTRSKPNSLRSWAICSMSSTTST